MQKKFIYLVSSMLLFFSPLILFSIEIEDLTEEFLMESPTTSYLQHFKKIFEKIPINSLLEFGSSNGTKYFLDNCENVTSYEIIVSDHADKKFNHLNYLFRRYNNWSLVLKPGSQAMQYANYLSGIRQIDPALHDATYLIELKDVCNEIFEDKKYDIVFVNPGFHMRGDLINELFHQVPIIIAHDTNNAHLHYGWYKIQTPSNYTKFTYSDGHGITLWIRHDYQDLIFDLTGNLLQLNSESQKLRVFFPIMHGSLLRSFAFALQQLGHTIVVPGESFDLQSSSPGFKISYGLFFNKEKFESGKQRDFLENIKNVEVIENDELLINPPDILIVNCTQVEQDIYHIENVLKANNRETKIVHHSGNNGFPYDKNRVKNFLSTDAYTERFFDRSEVNITYWIPWIDYASLQFEGTSDNLILNSYLSHYYQAGVFPTSFELFNKIKNKCVKDFPDLKIELPVFQHQAFISSKMNESCATLHIKDTEGFGYTIIESLAKGRPVFLKRSSSLGSRMMNWCIEGKTAFFFDDYKEFKKKVKPYLENSKYRHRVQKNCAALIRSIIDNEKQTLVLDRFLQNLK